MQIEAVSEMDSISTAGWEGIETTAQWNGRDLSTVNRKHHEDRISSVALQRARFDNSGTGYVLCRSDSRDSDDKVLSSDEDTKKSSDKESRTDMEQSVSGGLKYNRENDHSTNEGHVTYRNRKHFKNGKSLDVEISVSHERRDDRCGISDRTSGEIDASYNF